MISCRESSRLLSDGLDRRLGLGERAALRLHLLVCRGCRRAESQLQFLRAAVQRIAKRG